jgi:anti-sigma B factor antagonist
MTDSHFDVQIHNESGATVVALSGELDIAAAPSLEERLETIFAGGPAQLVVDLRQLEFIDSTGLSVLVKANQRAESDGLRFGLAGGGTQVRRLLSLTGISDRVTVADEPTELLGG